MASAGPSVRRRRPPRGGTCSASKEPTPAQPLLPCTPAANRPTSSRSNNAGGSKPPTHPPTHLGEDGGKGGARLAGPLKVPLRPAKLLEGQQHLHLGFSWTGGRLLLAVVVVVVECFGGWRLISF